MSSPAFAPLPATGPRTEAGKAKSAKNSLKHGLASGTLLLPDEDPTALDALRQSLLAEHGPSTATETLLVEDMARHHWLMDRAIRLQADALLKDDMPKLALLLRYQTANHRAFHKSLTAFQLLRKQFVSQSKANRLKSFDHDFRQLMEGPYSTADRTQFNQKYRLEPVESVLSPNRPPRNQR
jgi:hypothetical protein